MAMTKPPPPVFEALAGFTFVDDVSLMPIEPCVFATANVDAQSSLQHDHSRAKEPPILSLPFSISKPATATFPQHHQQQQQPPVSQNSVPTNENAFAGSSVPLSRPPSTSNKEVPTLTLVPPTPAQLTTRSESANIPDFFATCPVKPSANATTSSLPSGSVQNFFASSSLLSKNKAESTPVSTTPVPSFFPTQCHPGQSRIPRIRCGKVIVVGWGRLRLPPSSRENGAPVGGARHGWGR